MLKFGFTDEFIFEHLGYFPTDLLTVDNNLEDEEFDEALMQRVEYIFNELQIRQYIPPDVKPTGYYYEYALSRLTLLGEKISPA